MTTSALKAGHEVTTGARNPNVAAEAHPEVEDSGGQWLRLNFISAQTKVIVEKVADEHGGLMSLSAALGFFTPRQLKISS